MLRKYSYKYDNLNRLRSAHYQKPNNSVIVTDSYNESMTYDKNGNIMTLHRNGEYDDSFTALEIDDLDYAYNPEKPNELKKVTDGTNNPNGFNDDSDGTNDSADDYKYDGNGNLIADENKAIDKITYNHLNLPVLIKIGGGAIEYLYDATGTKLRKTVTEQQNVTVTEYLGGFQYLNAKLDFFGTAQGFVKNMIRNEVNNYFYIFTFTDHLGNVRLSYGIDPDTGQLGILEENNYYAYGLKHKNYNLTTKEYKALEDGISLENCNTCPGVKYKYNGQEWQDELGLNLYDMDFRDYDPAIGRWTGIDPITHHSMSPYMAFDGNPVYWADPSGADSTIMDLFNAAGNGVTTWTNNGDDTFSQTSFISSDRVEEALAASGYIIDGEGNGSGGSGNPPGVGYSFFQAGMLLAPTFFGVPIRLIPGADAASYFAGAINMSISDWKAYLKNGLYSDIGYWLMHEFGHSLQSEYGGSIWYNTYAAPASLIDYANTDYLGHQNHWAEIQASTLAYYYFGKPQGFLNDNIVNDSYVSRNYLNQQFNQYINHPDY